MSLEAGVVVMEYGDAGYWHVPNDRQAAYLPDSRALWKFIWAHREHVVGFAHSHPGKGRPSPSHEDLTTFQAIEDALGRRLQWWICSEDGLVILEWDNESNSYDASDYDQDADFKPKWLDRLRHLSYNQKGT